MDINMVTYCCPKDVDKLRGGLRALVESHKVKFKKVFVIKQGCRGMTFTKDFDYPCTVIESEDYPDIRERFGIIDRPIIPTDGDKYNWKKHCTNPLIGLILSKSKYTIFCDCDIVIGASATGKSWVPTGLAELNDTVIMVSPGHGQGKRYDDKPCSQMCFLCKTKTIKNIEYELIPEGYDSHDLMYEGRLEIYNLKYKKKKCLLGSEYGVIIHYGW